MPKAYRLGVTLLIGLFGLAAPAVADDQTEVGAGNEEAAQLAGIFPPLLEDGTECPRLPQPFFSAPGSSYGGHHSFPGGLVVHETFNDLSGIQLAAGYRRVYGSSSCPSEAPATTMITGVLATRGPEDITSSGLRRR